MVNDKVQASIRVCELLENLKSSWKMWEEHQEFYIHQLLPQLQNDMTRCVIDAERRILQELKRVASAEEWENMPYILMRLPEQRRRAWRIV